MRNPNCPFFVSIFALCLAIPAASTAQLNANSAGGSFRPAAAGSISAAARPVSLFAAEQLGDELMAQHRYQAALEIYSRVAAPSAMLWARMGVAYQMLLGFD